MDIGVDCIKKNFLFFYVFNFFNSPTFACRTLEIKSRRENNGKELNAIGQIRMRGNEMQHNTKEQHGLEQNNQIFYVDQTFECKKQDSNDVQIV